MYPDDHLFAGITARVEVSFATSVSPENTSVSATETVLPVRKALALPINLPAGAGRKKLILNSMVITSQPSGTEDRAAPPAA